MKWEHIFLRTMIFISSECAVIIKTLDHENKLFMDTVIHSDNKCFIDFSGMKRNCFSGVMWSENIALI